MKSIRYSIWMEFIMEKKNEVSQDQITNDFCGGRVSGYMRDLFIILWRIHRIVLACANRTQKYFIIVIIIMIIIIVARVIFLSYRISVLFEWKDFCWQDNSIKMCHSFVYTIYIYICMSCGRVRWQISQLAVRKKTEAVWEKSYIPSVCSIVLNREKWEMLKNIWNEFL